MAGRASYQPLAMLLVLCVAPACKGKDAGPEIVQRTDRAQAGRGVQEGSSTYLQGLPSVGHVTEEMVSTTGHGATSALAVQDAVRKAIIQVNGVDVAGTVSQGPTTEVREGADDARVIFGIGRDETTSSRTTVVTGFHDQVVSVFGGRVSRVEVLAESGSNGGYEVQARVTVPKFIAPTSPRLKVVIATPRAAVPMFLLDERSVRATQVTEAIRRDVSRALVESGRVDVLERSHDAELDAEVRRIAGGGAQPEAALRLGQRMAADLIWVAAVEGFEITRSVGRLRIGGGRTLEDIEGHGTMSHQLVNLTTGQVVLSSVVQIDGPRVAPTSLGARVSDTDPASRMAGQLAAKAAQDVVARLFPVVVLSRSGASLVLSQGRPAVREGAQYRLVVLGEPLVDPQTGSLLGHMEQDAGTVSVTSVRGGVAYGVATNPAVLPLAAQAGQIQVRGEVPPALAQGERPVKEPVTGTPGRRGDPSEGPAVLPPAPSDSVEVDFDFDVARKKKPGQ